MKEVYEIVTPKGPEIYQSRAICIFYFAKQSSLDVKCNNLSFGDPNWMIPIEEKTL